MAYKQKLICIPLFMLSNFFSGKKFLYLCYPLLMLSFIYVIDNKCIKWQADITDCTSTSGQPCP